MGVEKWLRVDHVLAFCKLLLQFALIVSHILKKKSKRLLAQKCHVAFYEFSPGEGPSEPVL